MQAIAFIAILKENSFMDVLLHIRLPCRIPSFLPSVKVKRPCGSVLSIRGGLVQFDSLAVLTFAVDSDLYDVADAPLCHRARVQGERCQEQGD